MVSHPLVLAKLGKPETLKYWLSLAEDYTRDLPLSRAAAGGLAMASNDEGNSEKNSRILVGRRGTFRFESACFDMIHTLFAKHNRNSPIHGSIVSHCVEYLGVVASKWRNNSDSPSCNRYP
jgi:hypothetical protein